jgi:hypothetical protein
MVHIPPLCSRDFTNRDFGMALSFEPLTPKMLKCWCFGSMSHSLTRSNESESFRDFTFHKFVPLLPSYLPVSDSTNTLDLLPLVLWWWMVSIVSKLLLYTFLWIQRLLVHALRSNSPDLISSFACSRLSGLRSDDPDPPMIYGCDRITISHVATLETKDLYPPSSQYLISWNEPMVQISFGSMIPILLGLWEWNGSQR